MLIRDCRIYRVYCYLLTNFQYHFSCVSCVSWSFGVINLIIPAIKKMHSIFLIFWVTKWWSFYMSERESLTYNVIAFFELWKKNRWLNMHWRFNELMGVELTRKSALNFCVLLCIWKLTNLCVSVFVVLQAKQGKQRNTINYHLQRISRLMKSNSWTWTKLVLIETVFHHLSSAYSSS